MSGELPRAHAGGAGARARHGVEEVHLSHEPGHEGRARARVHLGGRAYLLDHAVVHHHDAVGHGQGFLLVMGHHDGGDAQPPLQRADLVAQGLAHPRVERGERLVEEQQRGRGRQRPGQGNALLLAAGELRRVLVPVVPQPHEVQQLVHAPGDLRPGDLARLEPIAHIAGHGEIGKEGVGLEDDAVVALGGGQGGDVASGHHHQPRVLALQPGDDAEERGLPAPGGAEEADELARVHRERDAAQGDEDAELLGDALQRDGGRPRAGRACRGLASHARPPPRGSRPRSAPPCARRCRRRAAGRRGFPAAGPRCRGASGRWR